MKREIWLRRASLLGALALSIMSVASLASVAMDLADVREVENDRPKAGAVAPAAVWSAPPPLLKASGGDLEAITSERVAQEVRKAGLAVVTAQAPSIRPLGDGRRLVEMRITATGDAEALLAFANWVAVNRQAVRMSALSSRTENGGARHEITLLVVIG